MEVGNTGYMEMNSHTECPGCGADLGYYGDLVKGFECEHCGAEFELEPEIEYRYWCTKAPNKKE
jgi:predicted amidophosphoribosyltransferase